MRIIVCLIGAALSTPALAQGVTIQNGIALAGHCAAMRSVKAAGRAPTLQETLDAGRCQGYVIGAVDALLVENAGERSITRWSICGIDRVPHTILLDVVMKHIEEHPEDQQFGAYHLVRKALSETYPCD